MRKKRNFTEEVEHCRRIIESCENKEQVETASNYFYLFKYYWSNQEEYYNANKQYCDEIFVSLENMLKEKNYE